MYSYSWNSEKNYNFIEICTLSLQINATLTGSGGVMFIVFAGSESGDGLPNKVPELSESLSPSSHV